MPGSFVLRDNASATLVDTTVTGNGAEGIRVVRLSTAGLFGPLVNTIARNGGFDFFCAPNSFGYGDPSGVGRMYCPGFDQSPQPDPGGPEP